MITAVFLLAAFQNVVTLHLHQNAASMVPKKSAVQFNKPPSPRFCSRNMSTLVQVIVVFRNGDSTPTVTFPSDMHVEDTWPNGFGQLTRRGIERTFQLGQWTRQCYGKFLHSNASPKKLYARTSDTDQTLMSTQAYLAGAYPPDTKVGQSWGDVRGNSLGYLWQPIPVHTVDDFMDDILLGHKNCLRYEELIREINFAEGTTEYLWKDFQLLNMLVRFSDLNETDLLSAVQIIQEAVFAEIENGRIPMPWIDEHIIEKLALYRDFAIKLHFSNAEIAKITSGVLIDQIMSQLMSRSLQDSGLQHVVYAVHDVVIQGLLGSLSALTNRKPPYASAVIFELHKIDEKSIVKAFYRNSSSSDPITLEIPGCFSLEKDGCALREFFQSLEIKSSKTHSSDCAPHYPLSSSKTRKAADIIPNPMSAMPDRCLKKLSHSVYSARRLKLNNYSTIFAK